MAVGETEGQGSTLYKSYQAVQQKNGIAALLGLNVDPMDGWGQHQRLLPIILTDFLFEPLRTLERNDLPATNRHFISRLRIPSPTGILFSDRPFSKARDHDGIA